jgi:serine/threonine protein kinase
MSPEYAMDGVFSMKLDVYSLGVLVLEIITGKRNRGFYKEEHFGIGAYGVHIKFDPLILDPTILGKLGDIGSYLQIFQTMIGKVFF